MSKLIGVISQYGKPAVTRQDAQDMTVRVSQLDYAGITIQAELLAQGAGGATFTVPDWTAVERFHVHDGQRVMLAHLPGSAGVYVVDPGYALESPYRRFGPFTEERALEIAACHASFGAVDPES